MQKQSGHPKPKEKQKRYQQVLRVEPPTKYKQMTKSAPKQKPTKRKVSKYLPTNEFGSNIRVSPISAQSITTFILRTQKLVYTISIS